MWHRIYSEKARSRNKLITRNNTYIWQGGRWVPRVGISIVFCAWGNLKKAATKTARQVGGRGRHRYETETPSIYNKIKNNSLCYSTWQKTQPSTKTHYYLSDGYSNFVQTSSKEEKYDTCGSAESTATINVLVVHFNKESLSWTWPVYLSFLVFFKLVFELLQ